jgi:hypothetical protein
MGATPQKLLDQLLRQIEEVEHLGWTIRRTGNGSYFITNPKGQTATVGATPDRRGQLNGLKVLERLGLPADILVARTGKEDDRRKAIAADRRKAAVPPARFVAATANGSSAHGKVPAMAQPPAADGMRTVIETITPQIAMEFLQRPPAVLPNGRALQQRSLKEPHVVKLAEAMERGEWRLTPQGIVVATDGGVLDGQHRLHAIALAGVTLEMHVTYNVPAEHFAVLDTGITRTAADVYTTLGEKQAYHLSSATKLLFNYDTWLDELENDPAARANWAMWNRAKPTHVQLHTHVDDNLRSSVQPGVNMVSKLKGNSAAAITFQALVRRAIAQKWPEPEDKNRVATLDLLDKFAEGVKLGEMIGKGHPAYTTREWLLSGAKGGGSNDHARREIQLIALLKAWRRFCKGLKLDSVRVLSYEGMPLPHVPKDPAATAALIEARNAEGWRGASSRDDEDEA